MSHLEYLDFEIEIGPGQGREYPLAVIRSPGGEARERMIFPFGELALESRLKDLQIALLRSGGKPRLALSPQETAVRDFGQKLFDALMTGEIRSRYDVSQREAAQRRMGLRLKLRIQAPELAALPWEFLFDGRAAKYICLSTQTPLVRYIELQQVITPLSVSPPLRILGLVASPHDLAALDVENEKQRVERAIQELVNAGQVHITWLEHAGWRKLQRAMRQGPWHILHFIGHGGFDRARDEGFIALEDERGKLERLPATQLARLLADHSSLRLAILNSCEGAQGGGTDVFSSTASLLVQGGLPAVLAMQYEISDRAAVEFARGFYEALADDYPVDAATAEARKSVSLAQTNTIEWGTPVLHMRAPDGVLFRLPSPEELRRAEAEQAAREEARNVTVNVGGAVQGNIIIGNGNQAHNQPLKTTPEPATKQERAAVENATREKSERGLNLNLGDGVTMEFVRVPAGEFWMGSDKTNDKQAADDETPRHKVSLDEYLIGKYPVTNRQYQVFAQKTARSVPSHWKNGQIPNGKENHPVVYVGWQDAADFCEWASKTTGQSVCLPSEAQWEKAARGTDGRIYPWGDNPPNKDLANYAKNVGDTTPVGQYPAGASPYGALDMAGNVWEWVADWYASDYYKNSAARNPTGPSTGQYRVLRGGSWGNYGDVLRVSYRFRYVLVNRYNVIGFRCAR